MFEFKYLLKYLLLIAMFSLIFLVIVSYNNFIKYDCDKPLNYTGNLSKDSMAQSSHNFNCRKD